jgi:hypothetical protein
MCKVTTGLNVDRASLSFIKVSDNLNMWLLNYRTLSRARFGGVRRIVVYAACWWNTLQDKIPAEVSKARDGLSATNEDPLVGHRIMVGFCSRLQSALLFHSELANANNLT